MNCPKCQFDKSAQANFYIEGSAPKESRCLIGGALIKDEEMLLSEAESEGDKNVIKEHVETLLQKALEPTTQLKGLFEKARRERKGVRQ